MNRFPDKASSRAILVGASRYHHATQLPDILAAERNLDGMFAALTDPHTGTLAAEHCEKIAAPTRNSVGHGIAAAAREASDLLLVYYAGHGLVDERGRLYLALPDTDPANIRWTALSYDTVREELGSSRASARVLILDCCFSGRAIEAMTATTEVVAGQIDIAGTYIITSTAANQTAYAPAGEDYTAFTSAMLAATSTQHDLTLDKLYSDIDRRLHSRGFPRPQRRAVNHAGHLALFKATPPPSNPRTLTTTAVSPNAVVISDNDQQASVIDPPTAASADAETDVAWDSDSWWPGQLPDVAVGNSPGVPERGADIETIVNVPFRDAIRGTQLTVDVIRSEPCSRCGGTGTGESDSLGSESGLEQRLSTLETLTSDVLEAIRRAEREPTEEPQSAAEKMSTVEILGRRLMVARHSLASSIAHHQQRSAEPPSTICPDCLGTTLVERPKTVAASLPPSAPDDQVITLNDQGRAGIHGGPSGDLRITVHVEDDTVFKRSGDDLLLDLPLPYDKLLAGATVSVPTLDGDASVLVPSGSVEAAPIRIPLQGIPRPDGSTGDLLVTPRWREPVDPIEFRMTRFQAYILGAYTGLALSLFSVPIVSVFWFAYHRFALIPLLVVGGCSLLATSAAICLYMGGSDDRRPPVTLTPEGVQYRYGTIDRRVRWGLIAEIRTKRIDIIMRVQLLIGNDTERIVLAAPCRLIGSASARFDEQIQTLKHWKRHFAAKESDEI